MKTVIILACFVACTAAYGAGGFYPYGWGYGVMSGQRPEDLQVSLRDPDPISRDEGVNEYKHIIDKRSPRRRPYRPNYGNNQVTANQQSIAQGGHGSTVVASGNANAVGGGRYKRSPRRRPYRPNYGNSQVTANQQSIAQGGHGSTVVASGNANAVGGGRYKRSPRRRPYWPNYGNNQVTANQQSIAQGGFGSTVVAQGNANAYGGGRYKRSPQPQVRPGSKAAQQQSGSITPPLMPANYGRKKRSPQPQYRPGSKVAQQQSGSQAPPLMPTNYGRT